MIKDFICSILRDYQRLVIARFLVAACLFGGFLIAILILAILLMLLYPPYVWCVFGGFIIVWCIALLCIYAYYRIVRAEQNARLSQVDSVEQYVNLITHTVTTIADCISRLKKHK